ncbi:putative base excision dna repair protein [Golovinomyces cichoracearum]|uniref:Putative base excision dna repair protein n=1 Tax=Golovinomyces cichoracearum TaxID=62708 RepID=A0A420ICU4_9PEZI|nr:putative base excision dna repair protein [Golovinomyces cichoracearum]
MNFSAKIGSAIFKKRIFLQINVSLLNNTSIPRTTPRHSSPPLLPKIVGFLSNRRGMRTRSNLFEDEGESECSLHMVLEERVETGMKKNKRKKLSPASLPDDDDVSRDIERKRKRLRRVETKTHNLAEEDNVKRDEVKRSSKLIQKGEEEETLFEKRSKIKAEIEEETGLQKVLVSSLSEAKYLRNNSASDLKSKKLSSHARYLNITPFPNFLHPTEAECKLAHKILASLHGPRIRPSQVNAPTLSAGCGNSPSVLDALVRTILSQNTNNKNSSRAKLSMDATYSRSDNWEAIMACGQSKLQETIKCGGLSASKSRTIIGVLTQVYQKYGKYSLDHLHTKSSDEAMQELLSFPGVGPKTASCVLLFCLSRESFAVDTHVWRLSGLLGWRPAKANRDETFRHLDFRIPDEDKYGLHILLISHGRICPECRAGGKAANKCELRKAFPTRRVKDEMSQVKEEDVKLKIKTVEEDSIKKEAIEIVDVKIKKEENSDDIELNQHSEDNGN